MNKKILIIAFYYPPSAGAAVQRTLKAVQYLKEFGWDPLVLTAKPLAYDSIEHSQLESLDDNNIFRTIAFDAQRHLAIKGKHFGWMTTIDRWSTWIPGAILKGKKIIKEHNPDLILSTTPIPSANIIANKLAKEFNIPWIADYQDPLGYHHYPTSPFKTKVLKKIDTTTMKNCSASIFATKNAMDIYIKAFSEEKNDKFFTVENGFDEKNWENLKTYKPTTTSPFNKDKFTLFYSGVLYPNGRDPEPLFQAISELKKQGQINIDNFEMVFQGTGDGEKFSSILAQLNIQNMVSFTPSVPYLDSLYYMNEASALVLIQDAVFNLQVPGKLYEYIRTGLPILTITPTISATGNTASQSKNCRISQNAENIAEIISHWITTPQAKSVGDIEQFSRKEKTREMAVIFDKIISQ